MKRLKKKNIIIAFSIILVLVLGFFGTLYYLTSTVNNYSYSEKKWINENSNDAIDIYIEQNLPVFSSGGAGVYYDYINALKEDTGLNLNIIIAENSDIKLTNKSIYDKKTDVLFYKDHYVVIGKDTSISKVSDMEYKKTGIMSSDKEIITQHLIN